jgi:hypothetical protein
MRFLAMMKANETTESGLPPRTEDFSAMIAYHEELVKAGVLLAADGLQPSSTGVRVRFSGKDRTVLDGPFPETKELIAGYWIFEVSSREEVIEYVKRYPNTLRGYENLEIEIRPFAEMADAGDDLTPEMRATIERLEATAAEQHGE